MVRFTRLSLIFAAIILMLTSVSCRLFSSGSRLSREYVPISTEAVESLKSEVLEAIEEAKSSGIVSLVIDETQLTSLLAYELQGQSDIPINNQQVHLDNGQLVLSGEITNQKITAPVEIISSVKVSQNRLDIQMISANVGGFQLPQGIIDDMVIQVHSVIEENINKHLGNISFESIVIDDGSMTIVGYTS